MARQATRQPTDFKAPIGLVIALGGLNAFAPLSVDMYLPALPVLTRDLGAHAASGALTVASFYLGICLGQLFHGPFSDRVGRRIPLLAGIALYVLSTIGAALAGSMEWLIAMRFLQAVGGCAGLVISRAIVRDRFSPHESAYMFSLLLMVMSMGPIIAPLLGSFILLVASWRTIFWVLAAFGTAVGIVTFLTLSETRSEATAAKARSESPFASYWAVLREPRVMGYALAGGFSHAGLLTYLATAPDIVISTFHATPQGFGWVVAVNGVGLVIATYLNRRLLTRLGYAAILRRANLASLAASAALLIGAATGFGGLWGIVIPLFFIVAMIGFTAANAMAGAMAQDPHRAGSTSALVGFLQFGCGAVGATAAGALHDGSAVPMGAVIFAAYVIAAFCLRLLAREAAD